MTPERITSIMHHAELGLTEPELQLVIAEADENADGNIDVRMMRKYTSPPPPPVPHAPLPKTALRRTFR